MSGKPMTIYTIGHSTRPIDAFLRLLSTNGIQVLHDVRTVPGSRRNPQFGAAALEEALRTAEIGYVPRKDLGGLRKPQRDSPNTGWRNDSFRGYADYMQTDDFSSAIERLVEAAREHRLVVMCAEAVPWRCHRSLIGDALLVREIDVQHIISEGRTQPHSLTSFAVAEGTRLVYPAQPGQLTLE